MSAIPTMRPGAGPRRWLAAACIGLVIAAIATAFAWPIVVRHLVVSRLEGLTHRTVRVDAVTVNPFTGRVAVAGLQLFEGDDEALFAAVERFDARVRPLALLRGHLSIADAVLEGPTVRDRAPRGRFQCLRPLRPLRAGRRRARRHGRPLRRDQRHRDARGSRAARAPDVAIRGHRDRGAQSLDPAGRRPRGREVRHRGRPGVPRADEGAAPAHPSGSRREDDGTRSRSRAPVFPARRGGRPRARDARARRSRWCSTRGRASAPTATGELADVVLVRPGEREPAAVLPKAALRLSDLVYREDALSIGRLELTGSASVRDPVGGARRALSGVDAPGEHRRRHLAGHHAGPPRRREQCARRRDGAAHGRASAAARIEPVEAPGQERGPRPVGESRAGQGADHGHRRCRSARRRAAGSGRAESRAGLRRGEPDRRRQTAGASSSAPSGRSCPISRCAGPRGCPRAVSWCRARGRRSSEAPRATFRCWRSSRRPVRRRPPSATSASDGVRAASAPAPPSSPPAPSMALAIGEVVVKDGRLAWRDDAVTPRPRSTLPGSTPALPAPAGHSAVRSASRRRRVRSAGGQVQVAGRVGVEPISADLRVTVTDAEIAPYQPYVPVPARIAGRTDLDVAVVLPSWPAEKPRYGAAPPSRGSTSATASARWCGRSASRRRASTSTGRGA